MKTGSIRQIFSLLHARPRQRASVAALHASTLELSSVMALRERRTIGSNVSGLDSLSPTETSPEVEVPPHGIMLLPMYAVFGVIASFAFGREPGTLPHTEKLLFDEIMWPAVVTCAFVVCYSLFDTLGVGRARARCRHFDATAQLMSPAKPVPEELALALRAHANQVEQFPSFAAALWAACSRLRRSVRSSESIIRA